MISNFFFKILCLVNFKREEKITGLSGSLQVVIGKRAFLFDIWKFEKDCKTL